MEGMWGGEAKRPKIEGSTTIGDPFSHATTMAVAKMVRQLGFEKADAKALATLTTIAERLLTKLSSRAQGLAEVKFGIQIVVCFLEFWTNITRLHVYRWCNHALG